MRSAHLEGFCFDVIFAAGALEIFGRLPLEAGRVSTWIWELHLSQKVQNIMRQSGCK